MTRWLLLSFLLVSNQMPGRTTENRTLKKDAPQHLLNRFTPELRLAQIAKFRGDPKSEDAVLNSLRWLKKTQNADGSWVSGQKVGMTSLALLALLGHGESAQSDEFGITVLNAITYLVDVAVKNKGRLASDFTDDHWPYEHALAAQALAEAYSLCTLSFDEEIPFLKKVVEVSGQWIIDNQHQGGGWDYAYSKDSARGGDISITGWHLLALKACKLTGLEFKNLEKCSKLGLEYIERMQLPSGAIGYSSPWLQAGQDGTTLAAIGGLCTQIWKSPSTKVARKAFAHLDSTMKFNWNTPDCDLYGHFFANQAMRNEGGPPWLNYQAKVMPQILTIQNEDGTYPILNNGQPINAIAASFAGESPFATHYRTCLCTLILEVYYRYPSIPSEK